jgi:hypothetical protein
MSVDTEKSEPQFKTAALRMKCSCGKWNNIRTRKIRLRLDNEAPKGEVFLPVYLPIQTQGCKKCKKEIANPKEAIRLTEK